MNQLLEQQPIAALASGRPPCAIAVVRVSGENSHELIRACLKKIPANLVYGKMFLTEFLDPSTQLIVDDPLVVFFKGPHSYTGEDSAEIYLHGGPFIIQRVLEVLFAQGARPAQPGEFTERAFLNGKLDLSQAEGIRELTHATSHQEWLSARHLASGRLKEGIESLRKKALEAMAFLEARIDFPDEQETSAVSVEQVVSRVQGVQGAMERVLATYDSGHIASQGLGIALIGPPNAGKSTLLNELLGMNRALVSDIPGTTRDYLEERCLLEGRLVRLIDTAGIRDEGAGELERLGIERSFERAKEADLVLFLIPRGISAGDLEELKKLIDAHGEKPHLVLETKVDLEAPSLQWQGSIQVSNREPGGTLALRRALIQFVDSHIQSIESGDLFITSPRHKHALEEGLSALERFFEALHQGSLDEILAFELQGVVKALTTIIGDLDPDEVLGEVFSHFCVGK